jgi:glucosamine--fructose-6-phosphate aminotransferase (isomerizing)
MKTLGYNSVTIGCYPDSKLSKISSERFILEEGQEKSVATTKSFTSMLLMTQAFAALKIENKEYYQQLAQLPSLGKQNIEKYHQYLKDIVNDKSLTQFVFLGSGPFYGIACESMLKMKEMALVPSDAFHSLEFRHGPRSILSKEVLVTLFISDTARNYEIELLEEIKSLGATTLAICDKTDENISDNADYLVETNSDRTEFARSIIYMPMTQLLAFHKAISRGINPDVPRNLTHFVKL